MTEHDDENAKRDEANAALAGLLNKIPSAGSDNDLQDFDDRIKEHEFAGYSGLVRQCREAIGTRRLELRYLLQDPDDGIDDGIDDGPVIGIGY